MTNTNTNQTANQNQTNTKGDVVQMKTVNQFTAVNYTAAGAENMIAQFTAKLVDGDKTVGFRYGHSLKGGQAMYLAFDGKAPQRVNAAQLYARLSKAGVKDLDMLRKAVAKLSVIRKDSYVVGTCACGKEVTAANMDFIQRNFAKLGISEFDMACYNCQKKPVVPATAKDAKPATKEQAPKQEKKDDAPKSSTDSAEVLTITKTAWDKMKSYVAELEAANKELGESEEELMNEVAELKQKLSVLIGDFGLVKDELADAWGAAYVAQASRLAEKAERSEALTPSSTPELDTKTAERSEATIEVEVQSSKEEHNADSTDKHNVRKCGICREEGHNARTCPNNPKNKHNAESSLINTQQEDGTKGAERSEAQEVSLPANDDSNVSEQESHQVEEALPGDAHTEMDTTEVPLVEDELPEFSTNEHNVPMDDCLACEELFPANTISPVTGCCPECHEDAMRMDAEMHKAVRQNMPARTGQSTEGKAGSTGSTTKYTCLVCFKKHADIDPIVGQCPDCIHAI